MHRGPLWQFYLATMFVAFAAYRAAAAVFGIQSDTHAVLITSMALQALVGVLTAVGIWRGNRWALGALASLAAIAVATELFAAFVISPNSTVIALGRILITLVLTGAIALLLNFEFRKGESNEERAERSAHDPRNASPKETK